MIETVVQIPEAFAELSEPARHKAFYGGRAGGKSHSFATELLIQASKKRLRILCAREIQLSIRDSVKRLLDDKIADFELGGFYESTKTEIRGRNGSLFVFVGLRHVDAEKIKSFEGIDRAWVEEAHTVSQKSIDILVPTIRKPRSEIWWSWNPRHESDPVDAMFRGPAGPPPRSIVREVSWKDNPFLPADLQSDMEWDLRRDPDKYQHVWGGGYVRRSEARVFRNWRVGSEDEFDLPDGTILRFGADWGFATDPTVLVRCWIDGRELKVDYEARQVGCEIDKTPELFGRVPGSSDWPIRADSARPETISWMRRNGFPRIAPAKKGPGSVEDGVTFLQSYDIVVHPRCKHTIDELTLYSYKMDPHTEEVLPVLKDDKNHMIDSLRYATEGMRRAGARWTMTSTAHPRRTGAQSLAALQDGAEEPFIPMNAR